MLQHVCSGLNAVRKSNDSNAVFHHPQLVAHSDTANTWNTGEALLQRSHMTFKLVFVGQQHNKLGLVETLKRLIQISPLAHAIELFHTVSLLRYFTKYLLYGKFSSVSIIFAVINLLVLRLSFCT